MSPGNRTDAVDHIEGLLGSEGTRALAEAVVDLFGWREVVAVADAATEDDWNAILIDAERTAERYK